ncbi:hypothetical protein GCM10010151_11420 [Actinoallomurus spadix]|uniref:Uncharacterized protein n=1 Tax=Actinoallomurus spadix TaxID=79912 RepID=A0ABP3FTB2_9ACTN
MPSTEARGILASVDGAEGEAAPKVSFCSGIGIPSPALAHCGRSASHDLNRYNFASISVGQWEA